MGLDDFSSDESNDEAPSDNEEKTHNEQDDDDVSGLEAFRTSETDPSKKEKESDDDEEEFLFGVKPWRWNQMSKDERVEHVRDNYIPDYHPEYQPDERWSYTRIVEIECVCDEVFTFQTAGICLSCGRAYKDVGRTVRKLNEVDEDHNNE